MLTFMLMLAACQVFYMVITLILITLHFTEVETETHGVK